RRLQAPKGGLERRLPWQGVGPGHLILHAIALMEYQSKLAQRQFRRIMAVSLHEGEPDVEI
ncbi:hypothetical protein ACFDR9_005644, partial [Janthinobacterium sp. CG_23.3]|uniref:hypothetical protein n=1 Tax=Janthinobacterium sp. CG_23.3 TaxID=3349634 RepID=UPI0038D48488